MARAIGTRTISFGLVSIPIKVYSTTAPGEKVSFKMLNRDNNGKVKQQYIDVESGAVVERNNMVKGYEFAKDQFVIFESDEIKALGEEADSGIAIHEFVPLSAVDPVYFDQPYYLGPDKGAERAYRLLSEALTQTELCAIAQYSARGKQYIVLLRPIGTGLVMQQLRYAHEVRSFDEVPFTDPGEVAEAEMNLALQLIKASASETFDPTRYTDSVYERIRAAIDAKIDGQEVAAQPVEGVKTQVIDLMAALKASLAAPPAEDESDSEADDETQTG